MCDTDPPTALADDQCVSALNVEFLNSLLGDRRNGCTQVSLAGSGLNSANTAVIHISEWAPTDNPLDTEWWVVGSTAVNTGAWARRSRPSLGGTWSTVTPADPISASAALPGIAGLPAYLMIRSQASEGLIPLNFFTYPSAVDRLHCYDNSTLRRSGLAEPAPPSAATTGTGSYTGVRYFRFRYTRQLQDGSTLIRSEPSQSITFTPSGSGAGAIITRSGLLGESETHWEVEASTDNANFYRIATVSIGGSTYTDMITNGLNYPDNGELSETIGDYTPFPSVAFLVADGDRVIGLGHQTDITHMSDVIWSPVYNDPGVGNNERVPLSVNNRIRLDNGDGGPITGGSNAINGVFYVFKFQRIYQAVRTFQSAKAYQVDQIASRLGAIPGSVINGVDEYGNACVYFIDPYVGPCRVSSQGGVRQIYGLRTTWKTVNVATATIMAHGVYYPANQQIWWWVCQNGATTPNLGIKLQINYSGGSVPQQPNAIRGCWSLFDGLMAKAYASAVLTETVTIGGYAVLSQRPFMGLDGVTPAGPPIPLQLNRCDVGDDDSGTVFTASAVSKPFILSSLLQRFASLNGTLLAGANSNRNVKVTLIRDYAVQTATAITASLTPTGAETEVTVFMDNLVMSEARSLQVKFSD